MKKGVRHIDIAWGGVVSYPAWVCLEHNLNPDVEELERYNLEAKRAACRQDRRRAIMSEDDIPWANWICQDCGSSHLPHPATVDGGVFSDGGTVWRRKGVADV